PPPAEVSHRSFWLGLGIGSGLGWHTRRDLEGQNDFFMPAGVSTAALVHIEPEIGYRYDERTAFSLQSRHQLIPVTGAVGGRDSRPRLAHALFLRAHRLLHAFGDSVTLAGTAAVGFGSGIRLYVPARPD